jgi:hypothetical protein
MGIRGLCILRENREGKRRLSRLRLGMQLRVEKMVNLRSEGKNGSGDADDAKEERGL